MHLQEDNNTGTFPLQSERFFNALKGHGAPARVVLLPHEGHGYRARESVLHTLYEQVWLETKSNALPAWMTAFKLQMLVVLMLLVSSADLLQG